jgi:hypothetical protein
MMTATAVTGTAAIGWSEPAEAAVVLSEALPSLAAESFLPCLLLSVLDGFDAASLLAVVFVLALGLVGALLRSGEATFEVVSDWFWSGDDRVSAVADRSSLWRCGGAGAGASGGAGARVGAGGLLLALSAAMLLSTSAAKLLGPEDRSSLVGFGRVSCDDTLEAVSDVTLNTGGLSR